MEKWSMLIKREREKRGLTQSELAEKLGCDTKTIGRWELGKSRPTPQLVRRMTELFGKNAAELGLMEAESASQNRLDWGEAPDVTRFLGREAELAQIKHWIADEQCRMIAILGMGGCGKTTFARVAAEKVIASFCCVFWYSLRNTPPLEDFLTRFFQLFPESLPDGQPKESNERLSLVVEVLSQERCLLIIDNVESILQSGKRVGHYLPGYEGYGALFQRLGTSQHRSCLLLTSREKPGEVVHLEGNLSPVRSLNLPGLDASSGHQLLEDQAISGTEANWNELIRRYNGNPLALKLVSGFIRDLFGGDIAAFLAEGVMVFGDIHEVLDQQFQRLSEVEQTLLFWLAVAREPITLHALRASMASPIAMTALFEAAESLRRRSLLEAHAERLFTLQPVIMEYITGQLVTLLATELASEQLSHFGKYALLQAQASDYVRESQARLLLAPIVEKLHAVLGEQETKQRLLHLLGDRQSTSQPVREYHAGNLFNLLISLNVSLRNFDGSHLNVRQASFRGVELPGVNFSNAGLNGCAFTDTFTCILSLAISRDGRFLAAGMTTGEVRIWQASAMTPLFTCAAHSEEIRSVAFSPDGELLASASEDHTIRLWETGSGRCRAVLRAHGDMLRSVAFSVDGLLLASASEDQTVHLWEVATGRLLHILSGHRGRVRTCVFHPHSTLLASGGDDGEIRFWEGTTGEARAALAGRGGPIHTLAWHPAGEILASGSEDHAIRLWNAHSGALLAHLEGHRERVRTLAFSLDGHYLASGSDDGAICLWEMATYQILRTFQGHTHRIWSLIFEPVSTRLISSSEDDTLRWWEIQTGRCLHQLQGYTDLIKAVSFSPDGRLLASGSEDRTIRLWSVQSGHWLKVLRGHTHRVRTLAFSSDRQILASGSEDETIRIWNSATGRCLNVLRGHTHLVRSLAFDSSGQRLVSTGYDMRVHLWETHTGRLLRSWDATRQGRLSAVAFHPHGHLIASGGDDPVVQIWRLADDTSPGEPFQSLHGHTHRVWSLVFSANGNLLASCSDDLSIRLWDTTNWQCQRIIQGHQDWARTAAFSPDATLLASGSHDMTVRLWDVETGESLRILSGHTGFIWSVAFSLDGQYLASGSDDGTIRLWEVATGACTRLLRRERPYEGMNITGVRGLSEGQKDALHLLGAIEE